MAGHGNRRGDATSVALVLITSALDSTLHWTPLDSTGAHGVRCVRCPAPVFRETVGRSTLEYEAVALVTCGMSFSRWRKLRFHDFPRFRLIFVRPLENTLTRCRDQCEAEECEKSLFQWIYSIAGKHLFQHWVAGMRIARARPWLSSDALLEIVTGLATKDRWLSNGSHVFSSGTCYAGLRYNQHWQSNLWVHIWISWSALSLWMDCLEDDCRGAMGHAFNVCLEIYM